MSPGAVVCPGESRPWTHPLPEPGSQEQMLKDIQKASLFMVPGMLYFHKFIKDARHIVKADS